MNIENVKKELLQRETKQIVGLEGRFLVLDSSSINFLEMEDYTIQSAVIGVIDFQEFKKWSTNKKAEELYKKVKSMNVDFIEYSLLKKAGLIKNQKNKK